MYSFTIDVPAPIEMYDGLHAALLAATGKKVDGLLLHLGHPTETGFRVIEIWDSKERYEHYMVEVFASVASELSGGEPAPPLPQQDLDVRGVLIPSADIWV